MRKLPFNQIFKHRFPAEDGMKPGLEGWESLEKPEKTLGKCSHCWGQGAGGGGAELILAGLHLVGNASGLELKEQKKAGHP